MIVKQAKCDLNYVLTSCGELTEQVALKEEAARELLQIEIKRAFRQGKEEGERCGYAKALDESHHASLLLHTLADRLIEHRKQLLAELKPEVIELAFQIAETLVRHELSQPAQFMSLIDALINQALRNFADTPLKVFLAPEDLNAMQEALKQLKSHTIAFHADPKLRQLDCRIECESGVLNAEIARELMHLKAKLL